MIVGSAHIETQRLNADGRGATLVRSASIPDQPPFVEIVLLHFHWPRNAGASKYAHHGQRIVNGQKLMQAASDMFLGWLTGPRKPYRHFFIRQLRDVKINANTALWSKNDFKVVSELVGEILARAHARSGDAAILRGYLGKNDAFDNAIASYATAYAKQTERDHRQFLKACKSGRLKVQELG